MQFKIMGMQVDELSHVKADVDYTKVPPIQQKRIIAFVNHFITNTVSYLNNFCQSCESRFMEIEYKMQKIEASLLILEAQLSSIPGYEKPPDLPEKEKSNEVNNKMEQTLPLQEVSETTVEVPSNDTIECAPSVGVKVSEDPRFAKFFKMIRVGVHEQAVRLKMQNEGFDPFILDNPDAIIPDQQEN